MPAFEFEFHKKSAMTFFYHASSSMLVAARAPPGVFAPLLGNP